MSVRSLRQNFLNNILAPLHLYRQKITDDATHAVINGASLTLSSIGRHLTGTASVNNKIKRVDRLPGNRHLQKMRFPPFFSELPRRLRGKCLVL